MNIKLFLTNLANSSVFKKSAHKPCCVSSHLFSLSKRISYQKAEEKRSPVGDSSFPLVFSLPVVPKMFGENGNVVLLQVKHRRLKWIYENTNAWKVTFLEKRDTEELADKADAWKYTKNLQRLGIYGKQSAFLGV